MLRPYLIWFFTLFATISVIPNALAGDRFESIQISIFPPNGGSAYKQLKPDGVVIGQHLSGDAAPRVFESRASLPAADLRQINQLISNLALQAQSKQSMHPNVIPARKRLVIVIKGISPIEEETEWDKPFESDTIQKLWDLIAKSRAGAW